VKENNSKWIVATSLPGNELLTRMSDITLRKIVYSPVFVYFAIWAFILLLYASNILDYGSLSNSFYFAISLNIVGILLGYATVMLILPRRLKRKNLGANIDLFVADLFSKKEKIKRIYYVCCLLGLIGVVLMYCSVFRQISLIGFFTEQATVKSTIHRSYLGTYLSLGAFLALPLGVLIQSFMKRSWLYVACPLSLCFLFSFSFWGRVPFVIALIIVVSCKIIGNILIRYQRNLKDNAIRYLSKISIFGAVVIILMFSFLSWTIEWRISEYGRSYNPCQQFVSENVVTDFFQKRALMFGSYRAGLITWSYLTASIPTLNYWVSRDSEYALGQASFPYIFRLFHKMGLSEQPEITGDRPLGDGLQLPTFMGYAYIDFGFLGVLIYSYLLGFISTFLYEKLFIRPKLGSYMYLSLLYVLVLLSPQICATTWTIFPIIFVGMWCINWLIGAKGFAIKRIHRHLDEQ
jgi:hypothetical protein